MNTLAERLRYAMEVLPPKKIKGVELARAVGVKPPSVSDWLSGKSKTMEGENLLRASKFLNVNPSWLASGTGEIQSSTRDKFKQLDIEAFKKKYNISDSDEALLFSTIIEKPFTPSSKRWVPVKAYSKMGMDGYFTDMGYEGNAGDGYVPTHSAGPRAYGIKGTGDSMFPAIRNGWYVVCDPDAELVPNEFVQVCLKDGRCTIKEFVGINGGVLSLLSVNGGERFFFEMDEVESITAITDIVPPSQHRQEHPYSH
ncbi:LexA family transcriptional regulator [Acinetobacter baumannii]|uniref:LexA family transcriptional regulator n=1 Tax=Acinetobacter baumannii TaxID=470 RepID=UPI00112A1EA1|nr:LexA family transcriptional regulator [Acinetobacter baumannii]EKX0659145.1 LexA family transcriptional regulator [Acinetobacter baumannii]EKX7713682.1 LexA family transcriptional regulator [Acinetobacter baumannii]TPV09940.1 LexA family transcriptional regulator [Acinetobacter baumannii]